MSVVRYGFLLCIVGLPAALVCCSLTGTDGLAGGTLDAAPPPASEAGGVTTADAAPSPLVDAGAVSDASQGPANLLANPDFENGCSSGWTSNDPFALTTESTISHAGTRACRICSEAFDGGGSFFFYSVYSQETAGRAAAVGESYEGEVWMRASEGDAPFDFVAAVLEVVGQDGGVSEKTVSANAVPQTTWSRVGVTRKVETAGAKLRLAVSMRRFTDKRACIVLDDARLVGP